MEANVREHERIRYFCWWVLLYSLFSFVNKCAQQMYEDTEFILSDILFYKKNHVIVYIFF
jgi:hypothetical protein